MQKSPFRAILDIRRAELPFAVLMSGYFFLVITSFWILKPIKKALFIEFYDRSGFLLLAWSMKAAEAELLAKILNMIVAFAAVVLFTWLSRRLRRQQLSFVFTGLFAAGYVAYALFLGRPSGFVVWTFYLYGDLFSTLMVATFFTFLNDSVTPDAAKRMYGLIGLGGVLGGVVGSTVVRALIGAISASGWLWICLLLALVIVGIAHAAGRWVQRQRADGVPTIRSEAPPDSPRGRPSVALEGAALVWRSPYLLSIVTIVGSYEIVSTLMDFQFTSSVAHYLDGAAIRTHLSTIFVITNVAAMLVQFFLTSPIMVRFGVGAALMVLPAAALVGSSAFFVFPALWTASLLNTADNAFSYSINQSAKEALYVPTSRDEKYKAKAFVDMFAMRFAKAVAVVVSLGITAVFRDFESVRWLSLFTVLLLTGWASSAVYAGRRFRRLTEDSSRVRTEPWI